MNWKKFLIATAMLIFMNTSASAQIVTVQGSGVSESAAIKNAKRIAVEQVIGTRIKSNSLMIDSELVFDAVQSRSAGYVTSCEILKKNSSSGLIEITARIDVSDEPGSALMKDIELVMTLNDPRIGVVVEHYGDDGGEIFKKYPVQVEAAIREELLKRGFTHVVDARGEVDYVIVGRLTVGKAQEIRLPNWRNINDDEFKTLDTGLSRSRAELDCKIKKFGESTEATGNEVSGQAVRIMASDAAQQVKGILSREASKVFSSVKIVVRTDDGEKILTLEEILNQTQGVNSIHVRSFKNGQCVIDVDTDLLPQNLYRALTKAAGDSLSLQMTGFSSITLEIFLR